MFLYLHGFASGPTSQKAQFFLRRFGALGIDLAVPQLDEGDFERLTVTRQLALIDRLLSAQPGPHVIVGSSLGGYLASLHASRSPVDALVLMAPAVDFARRLEQRYGDDFRRWRERGSVEVDHFATGRRERLSFDLIRDAARHEPFPRVDVPALVLQGRSDDTVPHALVEPWAEQQPRARFVSYDSGHELTNVLDAMFEEAVRFLSGVPSVVRAFPSLEGAA